MEVLFKYCSGLLLSFLALLSPVQPLILCVLLFVAIDFVTGVLASRRVAQSEGREWYFESLRAWRTLYKLGFALIAIVMAWLLDSLVFGQSDGHLSRLYAGFVCGIELWSFLENVAQLSDAKCFVWMRQYLHRRFDNISSDDSTKVE